jgi:hypothetical protein
MTSELHRESVVADSLLVCNWNDEIFDRIRGAGITVFNATVAIWEDFHDTCGNIAALTELISKRPDFLVARGVADKRGSPYRRPKDLEHWVDGLRKAGVAA